VAQQSISNIIPSVDSTVELGGSSSDNLDTTGKHKLEDRIAQLERENQQLAMQAADMKSKYREVSAKVSAAKSGHRKDFKLIINSYMGTECGAQGLGTTVAFRSFGGTEAVGGRRRTAIHWCRLGGATAFIICFCA
jgi:hypothetical protein